MIFCVCVLKLLQFILKCLYTCRDLVKATTQHCQQRRSPIIMDFGHLGPQFHLQFSTHLGKYGEFGVTILFLLFSATIQNWTLAPLGRDLMMSTHSSPQFPGFFLENSLKSSFSKNRLFTLFGWPAPPQHLLTPTSHQDFSCLVTWPLLLPSPSTPEN